MISDMELLVLLLSVVTSVTITLLVITLWYAYDDSEDYDE